MLDIGSNGIKADIANKQDEGPRYHVPIICGVPRQDAAQNIDHQNFIFGQEAINREDDLNISYVVKNGEITDFEQLGLLLEKEVFDREMQISNPHQYKFLVTEPPNNPKITREKIVDKMFDLGAQKLYLGNQAILSLFATGRTTGVVLDIGEGISHATSIFEGYAVPYAVKDIQFAGQDLTSSLLKTLKIKNSIKNRFEM